MKRVQQEYDKARMADMPDLSDFRISEECDKCIPERDYVCLECQLAAAEFNEYR